MKILNIVTGMSGAGKSVALRTFEDLGFEVIDTPPLDLLPKIVDGGGGNFKTALGIDVRCRNFSAEKFLNFITSCNENKDIQTNVIFIDCQNEIISKRYSETRRKHPLTKDTTLNEALAVERLILSPIRDIANIVIDTSWTNVHELKRIIENKFTFKEEQKLSITTMSFSYKKGVPQEADLVFDVRFLRNPYWDEKLRHKTGLDKEVRDYVKKDKDYEKFWHTLTTLVDILVPRVIEEGKSYLTIAFGCTGGRHRSVTLTLEMKEFLEERKYKAAVFHREIG